MHKHSEHITSPYSTVQLFDMVADIEKYPEFIPWVSAARISERGDNELVGELAVRFKAFSSSYKSKVRLVPPENEECEGKIGVELIEGPFRHLTNNWQFIPAQDEENNMTEIKFDIDFAFKSGMLEKLVGALFDRATRKMVELFNQRADELYGNNNDSSRNNS